MLRNAIRRWHWKDTNNKWTNTRRNQTPEQKGKIKVQVKDYVTSKSYVVEAVPFGRLVMFFSTRRKFLMIQNRDTVNPAFLSFGQRDTTDPTYLASKRLVPGETLKIETNCPVDDIYAACATGIASVNLSVTEGLRPE